MRSDVQEAEASLRRLHVLGVSTVADATMVEGFVPAHASYKVAATPSWTNLVLVHGRKVPYFEVLALGALEAKVFVSPAGGGVAVV